MSLHQKHIRGQLSPLYYHHHVFLFILETPTTTISPAFYVYFSGWKGNTAAHFLPLDMVHACLGMVASTPPADRALAWMNRVQDHLSKRTRMQCPNPERLCSHYSNELDFEVAVPGCVPGPLEHILKWISQESWLCLQFFFFFANILYVLM